MNVNEILTFIAQVFFVALSAVAIFDYLKYRNGRRRDFALFCSSLGFPLGITLATNLFGFQSDILNLLGAFVLFAQPYFLFRLLQYYRPSPRWLHWVILLGMVACWVILLRFIAVYPATTQVIIFGYCVIVDAYCTWEYSRGLDDTVGTLQRRLFLITASTGLFTLALAGNVASAIVPSQVSNISTVGLAITAISAILYYIAFIPPRWIRHAWQYEELRDFLAQTNFGDAKAMHAGENFQRLSSAVNQAISGMMSAVYQWNEDKSQWTILASTDTELASTALANAPDVIEQAWQQRQLTSIYLPALQDDAKRRQMQTVGARTWLLVPIVLGAHIWGVLLVLLRERTLFVDDDLMLLELFAQQAAMVQEHNLLIAELQSYSEQLERKVEERTRELSESEAALRELNATLEQRVAQRTAELQRSNEELDSFAYVASHDLKAPLRAIDHLATWIEQDTGEHLPESSRNHLVKLQARVKRMETLLNDLLAYSRVGRQRHPMEEVKITELIQDVTDMVGAPADFTVKPCSELMLEVERTPLETVFRNLIGNAIKHHHRVNDGCVEICAEKDGDFVKFTVKDDGPGIAPDYHQRIFEIFSTLLPRDQVEGSGIGLAIVKKSVESRGGTIWVESDVGKGTTIHFTWPLNGHT